jgi:hypothetical protein
MMRAAYATGPAPIAVSSANWPSPYSRLIARYP